MVLTQELIIASANHSGEGAMSLRGSQWLLPLNRIPLQLMWSSLEHFRLLKSGLFILLLLLTGQLLVQLWTTPTPLSHYPKSTESPEEHLARGRAASRSS